MDWPGPLETAVEIEIETQRPGNGGRRRTIIWVVVDDGDVFVRSVRGDSGRWYRDVTANPEAAVVVDGDSTPVRAVPATDPDSIERTSAALQRKYAHSSSLDSMVRDDILHTTLRLELR